MFCALLTSRYQVSVYRTNGPLFLFFMVKQANLYLEPHYEKTCKSKVADQLGANR